jgi:hypothetical protein
LTPPLFIPVLGRALYPGASVALDFTRSLYRSGTPVVKGSPSLLPGWTFTRASTGYAETVAGTLTSFASGAPRITDKGLLIEEARTNLLLRSQEFDNASWTKTQSSVTANSTTAPDGTATADSLLETATTAVHVVNQAVTVATATAYTVSFYIKPIGRTQFKIEFGSGGWSGGPVVLFDTSGLTATPTGSATGTIVALANGWFRITATSTTTAAVSAAVFLYPYNAANSYLGDITKGLYVWGAQLEAGAFPTSYIPTTTASATRAADFAAISGVSVSAGFTLISRAIRTGATTVGGVVVLGDSTSANRALIYASSLTGITGLVSASGSGVTAAQGTIVSGTAFGSGISFDGVTTARYSSQGGGPATITKALVPATITTLGLGGTTGGSAVELLNGYIQRAIIYPYAFTDAQLQAETA